MGIRNFICITLLWAEKPRTELRQFWSASSQKIVGWSHILCRAKVLLTPPQRNLRLCERVAQSEQQLKCVVFRCSQGHARPALEDPLGALFRLIRNVALSNATGDSGSKSNTSWSTVSQPFALFWNASKVRSFPGANTTPVKHCLALDTSPRRTSWQTAVAFLSGVFALWTLCLSNWHLLKLSLKRMAYWPLENLSNRVDNSSFPIRPSPAGLHNNKNGNKRKQLRNADFANPVSCHTGRMMCFQWHSDGLSEPPPECGWTPLENTKTTVEHPLQIHIVQKLPAVCSPPCASLLVKTCFHHNVNIQRFKSNAWGNSGDHGVPDSLLPMKCAPRGRGPGCGSIRTHLLWTGCPNCALHCGTLPNRL